MAYDNTNKGTLGKNKRKEKDTHPSHTGKLNVEGKEYWLSAWVKESNGERFFSLSIKPKEDEKPARDDDPPHESGFSDDIPFRHGDA